MDIWWQRDLVVRAPGSPSRLGPPSRLVPRLYCSNARPSGVGWPAPTKPGTGFGEHVPDRRRAAALKRLKLQQLLPPHVVCPVFCVVPPGALMEGAPDGPPDREALRLGPASSGAVVLWWQQRQNEGDSSRA
jgi:hypothetical protein